MRRTGAIDRSVLTGIAVVAALIGVAASAWSVTRFTGGRESRRPGEGRQTQPQRAASADDAGDAGETPMRMPSGGGGSWTPADGSVAQVPERAMRADEPMTRVLLGEVGDGKNVELIAPGSVQMDELRRRAVEVLDAAPAAEGLTLGQKDDLASAVRALLEPCVAGDAPGFAAALAALGCSPGGGEGSGAFFDRLAPPLEGASLGLAMMRVGGARELRMPMGAGGTASFMSIDREQVAPGEPVRVTVSSDTVPGAHVGERVLNFGANGLRAVEVAVPFRGGKSRSGVDGVVSLVMVFEPTAGAWQPARSSMAFGSMDTAKLYLPVPGGRD